MRNYSAKDVDSYIASSGREARPKVRAAKAKMNEAKRAMKQIYKDPKMLQQTKAAQAGLFAFRSI